VKKQKAIKNTKENRSSYAPAITLAVAFAAIKAVARGQATLPDWAGKKVYIDTSAKSHWENVHISRD
jgi:hypothetical protein